MKQPDEKLPQRLHRSTVYESPWVSLYQDRVSMPNGHIIEGYHFLDFGRGAVSIIVENEDSEILMERNSRYPTGSVTWELPAGGIEGKESVFEAAQREVEEETGYATQNLQHIYTYNPMNGVSNMTVYVMHCEVDEKVGQIDANEVQGIRWFNPEELKTAILNREITDGFALVGLLLHMNRL